MPDMQLYLLLTVGPLSTLVIVLFGVFLNNQRLNDVKDLVNNRLNDMGCRMNDMRDMLRAEMKVLESQMQANHSEMLQRFGDLDGRITRIENHFKLG